MFPIFVDLFVDHMEDKSMDEKNIEELMKEAAAALPRDYIYDLALNYVNYADLQKESNQETLTQEQFAKHMAYAGFFAGMRYTLENLEKSEEE